MYMESCLKSVLNAARLPVNKEREKPRASGFSAHLSDDAVICVPSILTSGLQAMCSLHCITLKMSFQ